MVTSMLGIIIIPLQDTFFFRRQLRTLTGPSTFDPALPQP